MEPTNAEISRVDLRISGLFRVTINMEPSSAEISRVFVLISELCRVIPTYAEYNKRAELSQIPTYRMPSYQGFTVFLIYSSKVIPITLL